MLDKGENAWKDVLSLGMMRNRDKKVRETEFYVRIPAGKEYTNLSTLAGIGGIGMLVGVPAGWIKALACFYVHQQAGYRHCHDCSCTFRLDTAIGVLVGAPLWLATASGGLLGAPASWIQPLACLFVHRRPDTASDVTVSPPKG